VLIHDEQEVALAGEVGPEAFLLGVVLALMMSSLRVKPAFRNASRTN